MCATNSDQQSEAIPELRKPKEADAEETISPVLARLIEEVRNEGNKGKPTYDRVHNRHNR